MKTVKKIGLLFATFVLAFLLTGCGNKTALSGEDFDKICKENGLEVTNNSSEYEDDNSFKEAYVAKSKDNWEVNYYILNNVTEAETMYSETKGKFEDTIGSSNINTNVTMGNYSTYTLTTNGHYMVVSRVDNTLLIIDVKESYKDDIKAFVKVLGY